MSDEYSLRFGGIARLYGAKGLEALRNAHVCVVGIGGVGSWVAEALARTGIGAITLIDMDDICVTNTNRQIHALTHHIGQSKVEVMAERIKAINPECAINCIDDFVTKETVFEYMTKDYNFVVDAIDSADSKAALIAHCKRNKIKIMTIGGAGGQVDPTKITVADLNKTHNDPLARKVRSQLRRNYNFSRNTSRVYGVSCVYSTEQLTYPKPDGTVCQQKAFAGEGVRLDCTSGFGSVTMVTASFGFVAASKVVEKLIRAAARHPVVNQ